jgi:hypothetical protein
VAVLHAIVRRDVVAARRGLADRDEGVRIAAFDAGVNGPGNGRVECRPDRSSCVVELRREELLEVGLVPRREETHRRIAGVPPRVAVREGRGEVLEGHGIVRRAVRRLATVRPPRRTPDRDQQLHPSLLRATDEIVEVVEPIRRIEWISSVLRAVRSRVPPHDDRSEERRAGISCAVEHRCPVGSPAEARVVLETDEEAPGHRGLRKHDWVRPLPAKGEDQCSGEQ